MLQGDFVRLSDNRTGFPGYGIRGRKHLRAEFVQAMRVSERGKRNADGAQYRAGGAAEVPSRSWLELRVA